MIGHIKKGALHAELGIPQGEKIGRKRLEAAKAEGEREGNAKLVKRANFALNMNDEGTHGVVSKIEKHEMGRFATLHVRHSHPKRKKGEKGENHPIMGPWDHRESQVVIPMKRAAMFHVGQKVGVGAIPMSGPMTDEMDADGDQSDAESPAEDAKESYRSMRNRIVAEPSNRKAGKV